MTPSSSAQAHVPAPGPALRIDPTHVQLHDIDRGPNWLFVRVHRSQTGQPAALVNELRDLCDKHFVYRMVLELQELETLPRELARQLCDLDGRLADHGGGLRLCGLSEPCEQALRSDDLPRPLANHPTRLSAVRATPTRG